MSTIEVDGLPELRADMERLGQSLRTDAGRRAVLAGAQVFEGGIKIRARNLDIMDTGAYINSVESANTSDSEAVASIGVEYGKYIEYGTGIYAVGGGGRQTPWAYFNPRAGHIVVTRGAHARPVVRPTFDQDKADAIAAVVDVLMVAVRAA